MAENIIVNRETKSDSLSMETKQLLTELYQRDDINRIAPGKHDTVTVITVNGKEKLQKRNLYVYIKRTYAVFKEKHLRPPQVLLSLQVPSDVCTSITGT